MGKHLLLPELMWKKFTRPGINCRENRHWDAFGIAKPVKGHLVPALVTAEKQARGWQCLSEGFVWVFIGSGYVVLGYFGLFFCG